MSETDNAVRASAKPSKFNAYWRLMRADRPIGWLLLLWPTLWALWLAADGLPSWHVLLVFVAGVWLTRAAGCVINDYADRWLDPHVARTRNRPLATGEVTGREALILFAVLMLVAFALVLTLNRLTILLSLIAAFLAATYPYMKRHIPAPQMYLGLAFGFGIPMAFAAVQGTVPAIAWILFAANVAWSTYYDTWYGMVDIQDDLRMGSKSTAIWFGNKLWPIQAMLATAFYVLLVIVGVMSGMKAWQLAASIAIAIALVVNYKLARRDFFAAFLRNNWIGVIVSLWLMLKAVAA